MPEGRFNSFESLGEAEVKTIPVGNTVEWVNPHIRLPFHMKEGEPSPLGLFVVGEKHEGDIQGPSKTFRVMYRHRRSGIFGRVLIADDQGVVYRDVDFKGIGFIDAEHGKMVGKNLGEGFARSQFMDTPGVSDIASSERERDMSEQLILKGFRTNRMAAILRLEEIVIDGKPMSIEESKTRGIVKPDEDPAIEIRLYPTKWRISDLDLSKSRSEQLLRDAKALVAQELKISQDGYDWNKYLLWFATTLGEQSRLLHREGYIHGNLSDGQNITLDARIVDLDSVSTPDSNDKLLSSSISEHENCRKCIEKLWYSISSHFPDELDITKEEVLRTLTLSYNRT